MRHWPFLLLVLALACAAERDPRPGSAHVPGGIAGTPPNASGGGSGQTFASRGGNGGVSGVGQSAAGSNDGGFPPLGEGGLPNGSSGGKGGSSAGGNAGAVAEPLDEASAVFDQETVRHYEITLAPSDLALADQDPAAETYVPGSMAVDGAPIGAIGFRYKGSAGAFLSPCTAATTLEQAPGAKTGKCSIKIAFDHADPDARFHGLKKLNFHSMNHDPSMLRERLAYALFREMGVVAPRAMHARVTINGKLEGLFVAVEQVDGRFTRSRFTDGGKGNLYKEVWPIHDLAEIYRAALETNEDSNPVVDRFVAFAADAARDAAAVEDYVDRAYVARYLAADRVMANDDGSAHWWCLRLGQGNNPGGIGNHNYYWYEEPTLAGRFWLIPWDLDSSLGATPFVRIQPEWRTKAPCECAGNPAQRPTSCDPLFSVWAGWNDDYERAVDEFLSGPFESNRVEQKLAGWSAQIRAFVAEAAGHNGAPTELEWQLGLAFLRGAIDSLRANRGSL